MGSSQNPPNLAYWPFSAPFPHPFTLDLLYDWGTKYVLVDESLYRAGSSFWNVDQTWQTLQPEIKENSRLKEVAVLNGVHAYELGSGLQNSNELLTNASFEEGNTTTLPGWKLSVNQKSTEQANTVLAAGLLVQSRQRIFCYRNRCRLRKANATALLFVKTAVHRRPKNCFCS